MKRRLSERERRFCRVYALLRNPKEAAIRAGWPPERAEAEALALLPTEVMRDRPVFTASPEEASTGEEGWAAGASVGAAEGVGAGTATTAVVPQPAKSPRLSARDRAIAGSRFMDMVHSSSSVWGVRSGAGSPGRSL